MKALDYIKQHPEIICWDVYRRYHDERKIEWVPVDIAQIEEDELVEDAIINENSFSCALYLTWY